MVDADKIKTITSSTGYRQLPTEFPDYLYYKHLIEEVFRQQGPFQVPQVDKDFYENHLEKALNLDYINKVTDICTFKKYIN
jgi:hypothetical protein